MRAEDHLEILPEGTATDKHWDAKQKKWSTEKIKAHYKVGKIIGSGKSFLAVKLTLSSRSIRRDQRM